jgi:hypothetical protein
MTLKDATTFWTILSFQTSVFGRGMRWTIKLIALAWFFRLLVSRKEHIFAAKVPPLPPPPGEDE